MRNVFRTNQSSSEPSNSIQDGVNEHCHRINPLCASKYPCRSTYETVYPSRASSTHCIMSDTQTYVSTCEIMLGSSTSVQMGYGPDSKHSNVHSVDYNESVSPSSIVPALTANQSELMTCKKTINIKLHW